MPLPESQGLELRREILLGFHKQFAENQRSREDSFLKFLALLGGALAGYVFLVREGGERSVPINGIYLFQAAVSFILYCGAWLVVTLSNNFRRDQYVNVRIRRECGVVGGDEAFPESYDPKRSLRHWGIYEWMPDFFRIFFWMFVTFQFGAILAFTILVKPEYAFFDLDVPLTVVMLWSLGLFAQSAVRLPWRYRNKLLPVMRLDSAKYGVRKAMARCNRLRLMKKTKKRVTRGVRRGSDQSAISISISGE